ncbi:transcription initiation factor IID [Stagonosporopsis vannaccii]|nr:transcription initiation factor IID [Stagonosporopsis vannaccii]
MTEVRMRLRQKGQQFPTQDFARSPSFRCVCNLAPTFTTRCTNLSHLKSFSQPTTPMPPPILPRVRRPPHLKTQRTLFDRPQVEAFLLAFGDNDYPLPETIRVLDEIVTDYIIETCHEAAAVAHHARRAKIKLDDFKFMLRRDTGKLGRVSEMLETDKELKRKRKAFDTDEGAVLQKGEGREEEVVAPKGKVEEEGRRKKKKKGGKKERGVEEESVV